MYSGLLPPGMNESDVELSSDDEIQVDAAGDRDISTKKSVKQTASEEKLDIYLDTKSSSISETTTINTDEIEQSDALSEECPRGVSLQIWTTSLEKNIDKAVAKGDLVQAEALSDMLATRERV
ncbi:Protein FAM204A [Acipenser ruthenus]|uniref:Protein FAM204A n=1 Tax=Acipenser ruthenus TaxID=7906 RepID=A0A444ULU3_ACIRT|nr:Protein FAM204A [Acipenser ruthenus]